MLSPLVTLSDRQEMRRGRSYLPRCAAVTRREVAPRAVTKYAKKLPLLSSPGGGFCPVDPEVNLICLRVIIVRDAYLQSDFIKSDIPGRGVSVCDTRATIVTLCISFEILGVRREKCRDKRRRIFPAELFPNFTATVCFRMSVFLFFFF